MFQFETVISNKCNRPIKTWPVVLLLATVFTILTHQVDAAENPLQQSIEETKAANQRAADSQNKIDKLSDQTQALYNEYKQSLMQLDNLKLYDNNLEQLIASQQNEIQSYNSQLSQIDNTQRDVIPLMIKMVDTLDEFIKLDQPFLLSERKSRVAELKALLTRSDVATSEKYRRIMEAYQVEMEYGRTIEAYRDTLNTEGGQRSVDFFRLGRVALYYQTLDGSETAIWDKAAKKWNVLSSGYRLPVSKGIRIARKQAAPDLLLLPMNAAENVQ